MASSKLIGGTITELTPISALDAFYVVDDALTSTQYFAYASSLATFVLTTPTVTGTMTCTTRISAAGSAMTDTATIPAVGASAQAGVGITHTASDAIAGNLNNGAAAGGGFTFTAGAAKRLVSGDADGGGFTIVCAVGIGTGVYGAVTATCSKLKVIQGGGTPGTHEVDIYHDGTIGHVQSLGGVLQLGTYCFAGTSFNPFIAVDSTMTRGMGAPSSDTCALYASSATCFAVTSTEIRADTAAKLGFALSVTSSLDSYFTRKAAGVLGVTSWLQNTGGEAVLASGFTRSDTTLTNTALSLTVISGRSYRIEGCLQCSNTTAAEGIKIDFTGGSAAATTFFMSSQTDDAVVAGTLTSTTLAGVINYTTLTGTDYIWLRGYFKPSGNGTFIMRAAENSTATGTVTIGAGSWLALYDSVAL